MKEYKFYLIHVTFQNFTEVAFISFSSLLVYLKTGSVLETLIFGMMLKLVAMTVKSLFVRPYLGFVKRIGVIRIMTASLVLWGASLVGLFLIQPHGQLGIAAFFLAGIVYSVAHSGYWILSNALGFSYVGSSKTPGTYSSYWQIATIFPGVIAALAGLFLNAGNNFLTMFLLMGLLLIVSIVPLRFVTAPEIKAVSFRACIKHVSSLGFWSNVNPEYTIMNVAIPLITLFLFGSLSKSIFISAVVIIVTIVLVYLMGEMKDRKDNRLAGLSGLVMLGGLVYYGVAHSQLGFIVAGIIVGVTMSMVDTSREAGVGRELTNNQDPIAGAVAVEFARSLGGFLGYLILIIAYLITGSLWQPILIFGAVMTLPKVFYAIRNIQSAK